MKNQKQNTEVVKEYYSELAEKYDEVTSRNTTQWKAPEKANEFILPYVKPGDRVLDIGVGTGQSSKALHEKGCEITGIDIADGMLKEAAKNFPKWRLIEANVGNGLPKEVKGEKFDVIISVGALEFVSDFSHLLRDTHTVLRKNGYFMFTYENLKEGSKFQDKRTSSTHDFINKKHDESKTFFHYCRTPDEVEEVLSDADFEIIKQEEFIAYKKSKSDIPVFNVAVLTKKASRKVL